MFAERGRGNSVSSRLSTPRLLATSVLVAALLAGPIAMASPDRAPAARAGEITFTFPGRGWGHGVGMSQWGAYGRARAGWSAARILRHYYRDTRVQGGRGGPIRVLLAEGRRRVAIGAKGGVTLRDRAGGRRVRGAPGSVVVLLPAGEDGITILRAGRPPLRRLGPVDVRPALAGDGAAFGTRRLSGRRYRGTLRISREGSRLRVVNQLGLEAYLKGVVPREMPPQWGDDGPAALRAQAIAARSYALATRRRGDDFDAYADVRSQVYGGIAAEDGRTSAAVDATRGRVVTHAGRVATTFFFSTSGGRTEDAANVFGQGAGAPYLTSVPDPFDAGSPYHRWPDPPTFSAGRLGRLLGLGAPAAALHVVRRGRSPRVLEVLAVTASGVRRAMTGADIRTALGLRDTWFSVVRRTGGTA